MVGCSDLLTSSITTRSSALLSTALLARDLRAFLARFGQSDRDRLLATLHFAAFAATAALERAFFPATHCALHALTCRFAVLSTTRLFPRCHGRLLLRVRQSPSGISWPV